MGDHEKRPQNASIAVLGGSGGEGSAPGGSHPGPSSTSSPLSLPLCTCWSGSDVESEPPYAVCRVRALGGAAGVRCRLGWR